MRPTGVSQRVAEAGQDIAGDRGNTAGCPAVAGPVGFDKGYRCAGAFAEQIGQARQDARAALGRVFGDVGFGQECEQDAARSVGG